MTDRPSEQARLTFDVDSAAGGWPPPWPNVAELASVLPTDKWTLVGGLMTQLQPRSQHVRTLRRDHQPPRRLANMSFSGHTGLAVAMATRW